MNVQVLAWSMNICNFLSKGRDNKILLCHYRSIMLTLVDIVRTYLVQLICMLLIATFKYSPIQITHTHTYIYIYIWSRKSPSRGNLLSFFFRDIPSLHGEVQVFFGGVAAWLYPNSKRCFVFTISFNMLLFITSIWNIKVALGDAHIFQEYVS